ncbi:MAG TPA: PEGA domain-containing protein [Humisphaera sp.]|jgi:Tol biopolymer transport system component|nr:PEGA domain-containing protein [Humisphaera sp.]
MYVRSLSRLLAVVCLALFAVGCVTTREITITARPDDALISIDGQNQGPGPITHKFEFHGDQEQHVVAATRVGYKDQSVPLTRSFAESSLLLEMRPQSRRVTFIVNPVPAVIRVDGKALSPVPSSRLSVELEFTADAKGTWTHHTVSADAPNWQSIERTVNWTDPSPEYSLALGTLHKDLSIVTNPAGAQVMLNGQSVGPSPVKLKDVAFPVDPSSGKFIPQRVVISKPGYDPLNATVNWDEGKSDYVVNIPPKTKTVRIITDPPGGEVAIPGQAISRDASGTTSAKLAFVPTDDKGTLPVFSAAVTKKTADTEWYPKELPIAWDAGQAEYSVILKEIRTKPVPLILPKAVRTDDGWRIEASKLNVLAMKDVTEPADREQPTHITDLPKGTIIDSLAISPDGSQLLFTTLSGESTALRSQIQLLKSDGSGGATVFGEENALSLTPTFTPDGAQILFSSNRAGRRLSIWQMSAVGEAGVTQLTGGEENALWPAVDSEPRPRLFYTALVDGLAQPRLYMTRLGTTTRTDLSRSGGMQPHINPKGDKIVFCSVNEKNGKRQILMMPDRGGPAASLGDPDSDEYDAVWSMDGGKIAFASNRGKDEETGKNYDIWVIDLAHPDHAIQVTQNGSWDDRPAWDPSGRALYFRSNRGGEWGIWKIAIPALGESSKQSSH